MKNLTDQLYSVHGLSEESITKLHLASQKTMDILQDVNQMKESASSWKAAATASIFAGPGGVSWPVLFGSSILTVYLGSCGLHPSAMRNVGLIAAGFAVPIVLHNGVEYAATMWEMRHLFSSRVIDDTILESTIVTAPAVLRQYAVAPSIAEVT